MYFLMIKVAQEVIQTLSTTVNRINNKIKILMVCFFVRRNFMNHKLMKNIALTMLASSLTNVSDTLSASTESTDICRHCMQPKVVCLEPTCPCYVSPGQQLSSEKQMLPNSLSIAEREYISSLTRDIEAMFMFIKDHIIKLVDDSKDDGSTYRAYVQEFNAKIDLFKQQVMNKLNNNVTDAQQRGKDSFYKGLIIVQEVLNEFLDRINKLQEIFNQYAEMDIPVNQSFKAAVQLGKNLKPILNDIITTSTITRLKNKIIELRVVVEQAQETELAERLKNIENIIENIQIGSGDNINEIKVVYCLKKRLARR